MPQSSCSSRWNASTTTCPASNGSSRLMLMRWNACWERQRVAYSALRAKNSRSGWPRPLFKKEEQRVQPQEHLPGDTAAGKQSFTELMEKVKESEERAL